MNKFLLFLFIYIFIPMVISIDVVRGNVAYSDKVNIEKVPRISFLLLLFSCLTFSYCEDEYIEGVGWKRFITHLTAHQEKLLEDAKPIKTKS